MLSASHVFEEGEDEEEDEEVARRRRRFSGPLILRRRLSSSSIDGRTESTCPSTATTCSTHRRSSFSYQRLPEHLIKLSILKLDGSSFEIQVGKAASVLELKLAVEAVFTEMPKEGGGSISWSHVWGHFCLCYADHKLTDNKALLRNLGIKDGDQLQFIRHLSIDFVPPKRRPSKVNKEENGRRCSSDKGSCHTGDEESEDLIRHAEFRFGYCLQGWFSYARLWNGTGRMSSSEGTKARIARFRTYCQRIGIKELLP